MPKSPDPRLTADRLRQLVRTGAEVTLKRPALRAWVDDPRLTIGDWEATPCVDEAEWIEERESYLLYDSTLA